MLRVISNICRSQNRFSSIERAPHADSRPVQHMGVNHSGRDILVTQQLLDGSNVVVRLQEMCRKTVTKAASSVLKEE